MLNIRKTSTDGRYTLIIQLVRERKRGVLPPAARRVQPKKRKAVATTRRKEHREQAKEIRPIDHFAGYNMPTPL